MLVKDIVKSSNGRLVNGKENIEIKKFIIDNREETENAFYIPLVGEKVDAHKFILDSVKNGIIGFFINNSCCEKDNIIKNSKEINKEVIIIEVEDTLKALYNTSVCNRKQHLDIPVVAITGSVGKTSTRQMIYSVVKQEKNALVTEKNYNGYLGLSLMGLKIDNQDICVLEAGIDRFGEMDELSQILLPDIAVVTMIGTSHIEKLKSRENIFKEKMCITKTLRGINTLVINDKDDYLSKVKDDQSYNVIRYDIDQAHDIEFLPYGISFYTKIYGSEEKVLINAIGEHNVLNALAAIKVGELLNISKENIIRGIAEYKNFNRRLEIKKIKNNITVIDDAYNASLDSMISGLKTVDLINGRKVAVLGDMLELGNMSDALHENVGKEFKKFHYDTLVTVGEFSLNINKEAKGYVNTNVHFSNIEEAEKYLIENMKENDILYFKASNGMKFSNLVDNIVKNN